MSFDRFGTGLITHTDGSPYIDSFDDGESWTAPSSVFSGPPGNASAEVGTGDDGVRVWVFSSSSDTIRVARMDPTVPANIELGSTPFSAPGVKDLKVAVNPAGDALIAWSTISDDAGLAFWRAGTAAPGAPQTLDAGCTSTAAPTPFLDPSRSATVVWSCADGGEKVLQSSAADAADPNAFGAPSQLATGSVVSGGQATDGTGVILTRESKTIPTNAYGESNTVLLSYASRLAGSSFGATKVAAGSDDRKLAGGYGSVAVGPDGRVLIGFQTYPTRPYPSNCTSGFGDFHSEIATGSIDPDTGELNLTSTTLSDAGLTLGKPPRVVVGSDGRQAVVWHEVPQPDWCYIKVSGEPHVMLALPGEQLAQIEDPALPIEDVAFNARGEIFALTTSWGPVHYKDVYDTDLPLTPAIRPSPAAGSGTSTSVGAKSAPTRAVVKIKKLVIKKGGRLSVTLSSGVAGKFTVVAKNGKTVVARSSAKTTLGIAKLQLKLNFKARKQLAKTGRLKTKLTINFAPTTGAAPAPVTKSVTFKRK